MNDILCNDRHLHVVLASDTNYAEFVAVFIVSLFQTNRSFEQITIHLLANGIADEVLYKIKSHIPMGEGELIVYDISDIESRLGISVSRSIAISAYARLFLAEILPLKLKRVLYVDCDVIVNDDLKDLFCLDFGGNWIAGVLDTLYSDFPKSSIGLHSNAPYLNSGILMVNLNVWRENKIQKRFLDFLKLHNGCVVHHDQGIINAVCEGHKLIVHPRYNVMSPFFSHPYRYMAKYNNPFYSSKEIQEAINKPVLIHFTEGFLNRPWVKHCSHPMKNLFVQYHSLTLWKDTAMRPDNRSWAVRILSWVFLHLPIWCFRVTQFLFSVIKGENRR